MRIYRFLDLWYSNRDKYFENNWSDSRYDAKLGLVNTGNKMLDYVLSTTNDNKREKRRNNRYNRLNTMGRLRKYYISQFETKDGKFIDENYLINVRNQSLKQLIKIAKEESYIKAELPLPINKYSRVVGVIKDDMSKKNMGKRRQYEWDYVTHDYLRIKDPDMLERLTLKEPRIFSGEWRYTRQNLISMCSDERDFNFPISTLVDAYFSRAGIDLILPDLGSYDPAGILGLPINPKANSGHLTSRMVSSKRRISTTMTKEASYYYAKEIMKSVDITLDKSLTSIGGREKRNKIDYSQDKKYKTRCINNPEDIPTLIGQSIIKPINETLQKINDGFNYGGRINGSKNFIKYLDDMKCEIDMVNINPDVSEHDASVKEDNVAVALAFLRCCFDESEELDRLFIYILSSAIFKRLVLPESGLVYEVIKGFSSGHSLTSILTTFVAYGTISTAIMKTHNKEEIKRTIIRNAGDDITGKVMTNKLDAMYKIINDQSGFKMDDLREYCGYFEANSPILRTTFLKKAYSMGRLCWNKEELMTNLLTPTMKEGGLSKNIENMKQMIFQAPLNHKLNNEIKHLIVLQTLYKMYTHGIKSEIDKYLLNYYAYLNKLALSGTSIPPPRYIIDNIELLNVFSYNKALNEYVIFDMRQYITQLVEDIDMTISRKEIWFLKQINYVMHKTILRLAVFDVGKLNTKPRGYYLEEYVNAEWN